MIDPTTGMKTIVSDSDDVWRWISSKIKTLDAKGGIKPFPEYEFTVEMLRAFETARFVILAKSRQMLATWTACAWMLYHLLHDEPGIYLLMSKGQRDTTEVIKRMKIMIRHLPDSLNSELKVNNKGVERSNEHRIIALPASEYASRMYSPSLVFWDEMAFTPNCEEIWAAVKPAIDSGGKFIGVSTPNGSSNTFHKLFHDDENGFHKCKLHWRQHPLRDEQWESECRRGFSESRWRQEYEIDFDVMMNRVFEEFDMDLHVIDRTVGYQKGSGKFYRGIDFGYRHPYVVWVHIAPTGEMTVIAEWEGYDSTVNQMISEICRIDEDLGLCEEDFEWSGVDPAGASLSDTGISAVERMKQSGFKIVYRKSEIMTGIELIKALLHDASGQTSLRFSSRARKTIEHLKSYRWDKSNNRPLKDNEHDHAVDALRYLVVNLISTQVDRLTPPLVSGCHW